MLAMLLSVTVVGPFPFDERQPPSIARDEPTMSFAGEKSPPIAVTLGEESGEHSRSDVTLVESHTSPTLPAVKIPPDAEAV